MADQKLFMVMGRGGGLEVEMDGAHVFEVLIKVP